MVIWVQAVCKHQLNFKNVFHNLFLLTNFKMLQSEIYKSVKQRQITLACASVTALTPFTDTIHLPVLSLTATATYLDATVVMTMLAC